MRKLAGLSFKVLKTLSFKDKLLEREVLSPVSIRLYKYAVTMCRINMTDDPDNIERSAFRGKQFLRRIELPSFLLTLTRWNRVKSFDREPSSFL